MATARKSTGKSAAKKSAPAKAAKAASQTEKSVPGTKSKKLTTKSTSKKATAKSSTKMVAVKKVAVKKAVPKKMVAKPVAKRATKRPVAKKPDMSKLPKKFVDNMKARLLEERGKYLQTSEDLRAEADSLFADREPGDVQFDEESGEGDTLAVERERGLALSSQAASAVQQIDDALARIADGTYGICVTSGLPIPKNRLSAIPWAAERVEVKVGGLSRR